MQNKCSKQFIRFLIAGTFRKRNQNIDYNGNDNRAVTPGTVAATQFVTDIAIEITITNTYALKYSI